METNLENPLSRQNQFSHVNTNKAWKWKSLNPVQLRNCLGQNTGLGSLSLLQGIFPTQGSDPALLHCRWILYHLSYDGSPRRLVWVAYPFSRESSLGCHALLQGIFPTQGIKPGSPALQVDSLPAEAPGKPKNTGVGSLCLLQRIFSTRDHT